MQHVLCIGCVLLLFIVFALKLGAQCPGCSVAICIVLASCSQLSPPALFIARRVQFPLQFVGAVFIAIYHILDAALRFSVLVRAVRLASGPVVG